MRFSVVDASKEGSTAAGKKVLGQGNTLWGMKKRRSAEVKKHFPLLRKKGLSCRG
jgi:hypothetical protein